MLISEGLFVKKQVKYGIPPGWKSTICCIPQSVNVNMKAWFTAAGLLLPLVETVNVNLKAQLRKRPVA